MIHARDFVEAARQRGFDCYGGPEIGTEANLVPLARDAGLGEIGKNGLLITEKNGPRVKSFFEQKLKGWYLFLFLAPRLAEAFLGANDFNALTRNAPTPEGLSEEEEQAYFDQLQGFVIEQDAQNWIRLDTYFDGLGLRAFGAFDP